MARFDIANLQGWIKVVDKRKFLEYEYEVKFTKEDFDFSQFSQFSHHQKKMISNLYNSHYMRILSYWISIFMRGRDRNTSIQVNAILKYLFVRNNRDQSGKFEFEYISNTELRRKFVGDNRCGRPPSNPIIKNRQTLENLLKLLVKDEILEMMKRVDPSPRSKDTKRKKTPYYRINVNKFFGHNAFTQVIKENLYIDIDPSLSKQELIKKYQHLADEYEALSYKFKQYEIEVSESKFSADVILKIMKYYGITESDDELLKTLKQVQFFYNSQVLKQPIVFYAKDEMGNIVAELPGPDGIE